MERVHALGLPAQAQVTMQTLCEHVGRLHGRPIHLVPLELPLGSPDGLWVSAEGQDYVFFEQRLAPVHQQQVILHEFGHVICDHDASPVMTEQSSTLLLPSLNPNMVRRVLGREHSQAEAEVEAELVGSLIGRQISSWSVERTCAMPPEARELVARLAALEAPIHQGKNE
ncbi:hypothetical protein J1792_32460 [Streptomyces triculaminicus]|uniref:IrrE N-terminal-like domain-containing protein n=1 Tax=Streptomyces triculaminicus TaxID=2816232 RepID=A0A939FV26_9ACTN|nr:hypothetical protein [Streptomyces triculaminicus]MBO0657258.1 hypothetical protein [Streptomyces triculaminicus]